VNESSRGRKSVKNVEVLSGEEVVVVGEWRQKCSEYGGKIYN
jgi:hypothetical protein